MGCTAPTDYSETGLIPDMACMAREASPTQGFMVWWQASVQQR